MRKMKAITPVFYADGSNFIDEFQELNESSTDLIEVRLDRFFSNGFKPMDLSLLKNSKKPLILTLRTSKEGGECEIETSKYESLLHFLQIEMPQALIDIELSRIEEFKEMPDFSRVVLSYHNFSKTPQNLDEIWQAMEKYQPKIEKIAVMPAHASDVTHLLYSCANHQTQSEKIAISMSELGSYSRAMGFQFGSTYTFVSLHTTSAPGQFSLDKLDEILAKVKD
jgi:3-dehydroquinate dehydratase type I